MGRERVRTAAAPRHRPFLLHHPAEKEGCAGLGAGRGSALSPQGHIASCITPGDALRYHGLPGRREDPRNLLLFLHLHHSPPGSFSPALCMGMGKKKKKKKLLHRAASLLTRRGAGQDAPSSASNTTRLSVTYLNGMSGCLTALQPCVSNSHLSSPLCRD